MGTEEEVVGNRQRHNRHARDPASGSLEKRIDELEKVKDDDICMCRGVSFNGTEIIIKLPPWQRQRNLQLTFQHGCMIKNYL